eukprot:TRINITY_DN71655_c0_g1_i1.p1 TRINITY_DN71655_c0_g1~~TRINITY_DN71655_c0_g1_i1.p1  ORF type:complete len:503 (-),score=49.99 TRINITY_DN71655_c0_g1_i1:151-1659(-)
MLPYFGHAARSCTERLSRLQRWKCFLLCGGVLICFTVVGVGIAYLVTRARRDVTFYGCGCSAFSSSTSTLPLCSIPSNASHRSISSFANVSLSQAATGASILTAPRPFRILFVGNSFTYGPPPYDQSHLSNLPRFFKLVAESMGRPVLVAEDTISGCTLHAHRPSLNPEACDTRAANAPCQLLSNRRLRASAKCTGSAKLWCCDDAEYPCPQILIRQPYGGWDAVVVQDFSSLPTVRGAREAMLIPSVRDFASAIRHQGLRTEEGAVPILAAYMTWSYPDGGSLNQGGDGNCPIGNTEGCFPFGTLAELTPNCDEYDIKVNSVSCMTYALARGYAETMAHGVDVLVPAGLAWLAARGAPAIPKACRAAIDAEYSDGAGPLSSLELPLRATDPADARWSGAQAGLGLFRCGGPTYRSGYCDCRVDHHPSAIAMYLNAVVFYATLFNETPVGATWPDGTQTVDGMLLPAVNADEAKTMQRIAADVVLPHRHVWWGTAPHATAPT